MPFNDVNKMYLVSNIIHKSEKRKHAYKTIVMVLHAYKTIVMVLHTYKTIVIVSANEI